MIVEPDLFSQSFTGPFELENPEASIEKLSSLTSTTTLLLREERKQHAVVGKKGGKISPFRNRACNHKIDLSASERQRIQAQ